MTAVTAHTSERARDNARNLAYGVCASQVAVAVFVLSGVARVVYLAVVVAFGVAAYARIRGLRVEEHDDGLVVRNLFRTWRLRWDEIERFDRRPAFLVSSQLAAVCPVAVTPARRVVLLAVPVEIRRRKHPPRRLTGSAVLERWERRVAG